MSESLSKQFWHLLFRFAHKQYGPIHFRWIWCVAKLWWSYYQPFYDKLYGFECNNDNLMTMLSSQICRWLELDNEIQYWICLTLLMSESKYISVDLVWVHLCSLQSIFHRCPCLQTDISQYFPAGRLILSHCTATNTLQNLFPQLSQLSLLTTDTQVKAKRIEAEINPWEETLLWEIWRLVGLCWWEHLSLGELPLVAGCRARSQCQLCSAAAFLHSSCPYLLLRNPPPTSPLSHRPCQAIWGLIWVWSKTLNGRKLIFDVAFFLSSCPYWLLPLHSLPLVTTHAPTQAPIAQSYRPAV